MARVIYYAIAQLVALIAVTVGICYYFNLAWYWTLLLTVIIAVAAVGYVVYRGLQRVAPKPQEGIPCPPLSHPVLGHPDRMISPIKHELRLEVCESTQAPFHQLLVMKHVSVFINDAAEAVDVLKKFLIKGDIYKVFRLNTEIPDLLTSDGHEHILRKKALSPSIEHLRISAAYLEELTTILDKHKSSGTVFDAAKVFSYLSFDVMSMALFGYDLGALRGTEEGVGLHTSISILLEAQAKVGIYADPNTRTVPPEELRAAQVGWKNYIESMKVRMLAEADAHLADNGVLETDKLSHALKQLLIDNESYCDAQVTGDIHQLFRHGYECLHGTLCWMFYALAYHPKVQKKLYQEIKESTDGVKPEYLECVVKEVLRRYPVGGNTTVRTVIDANATLSHDVPIAVNTPVHIHMWSLHNTAREWDKPRAFLPDRWLASSDATDSKPSHPKCPFFAGDTDIFNGVGHSEDSLSFFPFSAGDRSCLGKNFALTILRDVLFSISSKFRFNFSNSAIGEDYGVSTQSVIVPRNADSTMFRVSSQLVEEVIQPKADEGWADDSDHED